MDLFLDTADIEQIKQGFNIGILKGVTTNPSILLKAGKSRSDTIKAILENSNGLLFVQTVSDKYRDIMIEANELLSFDSKRIGIKIPVTPDGIKAIQELKKSSVKTLATAVFSTSQAIISAIAGADYIAPYINRMEQNGIDAIEVIKEIRNIYEMNCFETKILAASFRNVEQVIRTIKAGAHSVTISYELFCDMFNNYLTDKSIKKFAEDWVALNEKIKIKQ
ncbi:transaldolase family protein [Thermoanaerobacterium thermosaccharolyticum]|uniref:Transaldolase n=1 Tax=Thermoanaerobacterium thermosaccharolyticum (strain ATCC 7956 / DSM 571 / NCIMB 9385 / NCA 3814 / NCTC 13789 / WDCM 00135 / 2032) TaxID=580327 RepID=D9TSZ3_THETC|nr:transaldolase family protein [Thermoanaerobacterium thermosaccharolyticum]ADL69391.1 Transaldolase [Thermoanaerobacterium thermosaccharolyticum DSM 571]